ncbi:MAG TPA: histidine kinase [Ktedonobacterales bacterium]|nr:histidine kinase [Ktedonobacterales bacterium]
MTIPVATTPSPPGALAEPHTPARLRGRWLVVARAGWLALAVLTLALLVASLATEVGRIQALCPTPACSRLPLSATTRHSLATLGLTPHFDALYGVWLDLAFALGYGVVAVVIFARRSDDRFALFTSLSLLLFGASTFTGALDYLTHAYPAWRLPAEAVQFLGSAGFISFLYLFPGGRLTPRWLLAPAIAWNAQQLCHTFAPGSPLDTNTWAPPLAIGLWVIFLGSVVYAQISRYRHRSTRVQRQQTKWVVLGIAVGLVGLLAGDTLILALNPNLATLSPSAIVALLAISTAQIATMLLIPLAIGVALLRYHLFDVDLIINRALVYTALTASVILLYVLLVGALGQLLRLPGNPLIAFAATGIVAVAFQPVRDRLQRGANRLLYGQRDEPYAVLSRLGQRLEATLAPDAALPTIVETVAQALKLPHAAIALKQDDGFMEAAIYGMPTGEPLALPLIYQNEPVGRLILSPRAPSDAWTAADRRLLDDLAHQAGVAAYAVRLNLDLRHAREQLVLAREEERRRLRRDLHDGLGPQLASQTLTLTAAIRLLRQDPAAAEALLTEATAHAQAAIADIRRVVYDLRPPALDDLGLVAAIREQAARYHASGVRISVAAPEHLPALPAAVEVACYRIADEALTNVVRHAHATSCEVALQVEDALLLEICDDGRGLPPARQSGVGLNSMRERAAELGGSCTIEAARSGGTRVYARLPLT